MSPSTTFVSRRELIEDAVFAESETDGKFPADRNESVLSAIYYVLTLLAARQDVNYDEIERYAGNVRATRPRLYVEPTPEEIERREEEETRRSYASRLAQIKRRRQKAAQDASGEASSAKVEKKEVER